MLGGLVAITASVRGGPAGALARLGLRLLRTEGAVARSTPRPGHHTQPEQTS
jgi:hypothetical protein